MRGGGRKKKKVARCSFSGEISGCGRWESLPDTRSRLRRPYAAFFFAALTFAHLARCAAAIFLRDDADIVRFAGTEPVVFAAGGCDPFRDFAQRNFCAMLIRFRAEADNVRLGLV
jgi:hypothetical protein